MVEQRLDFSRWVEEGFETGDCVIMVNDVLQIIDYKHGLGVLVSAERNPQMMCYALGAVELFDGIYDIREIRMTIYQPRRENVSTYSMTKEEELQPLVDSWRSANSNIVRFWWDVDRAVKKTVKQRKSP